MSDIIELVWQRLEDEIAKVGAEVQTNKARSERSETSGGFTKILFANLPYTADGAGPGDCYFVTNGRKTGEGAGTGTGIPAYFNVSDNSWRRFYDDAAVTI